MSQRVCCAAIVLSIVGITCTIGGILLFVYSDSLITANVKKGCQLQEGTDTYAAWRQSPVKTKISFYLFNITNPGFLTGGQTPHLQEVGPFVYEEKRTKFGLGEYINGTISYHENRSYTFIPSESVNDSIQITTMNIAYMTIVNLLQTKHVADIERTILMAFLSNDEQPVTQKTAKQLLWGYVDPFLQRIQAIFPHLVADDTISIYNASVSGAGSHTFLINSGVDILRNQTDQIQFVGNVERFDGNQYLPYWRTKYANTINGTDATIWHPDVKNDDTVHIFIPDICRSLTLTKRSEYVNPFGITLYRFGLIDDIFANSVRDDFCLNATTANKTSYVQCLPDGLLSLSTCIKPSGTNVPLSLPIVASNPFFINAAREVVEAIVMGSNRSTDEQHHSFMDIEPITGTVMNGSRRLQINLHVLHDQSIGPISTDKDMFMPMMWLDEHTEIDKKNADKFIGLVYSPMKTMTIVKYVLVCVGGVVVVIACGLVIRMIRKRNQEGAVFPSADENTPLFS